MKRDGQEIIYSPSDLIIFMSDPFSSFMDRVYLENPEGLKPDPVDESAAIVQKHGLIHEREFLETLEAEGLDICVIEGQKQQSYDKTVEAMQAGREVIYQGLLKKDNFAGLSDFLIRRPGASKLGDFHYEVWDSKLARKAKPYFLVQLSCYAEMLAQIQGCLPLQTAVVLGNKEIRKFAVRDFYYFYSSLKEQFLKFQADFDCNKAPEFLSIGPYSRWKTAAEMILSKRDDLSRVADIRKSQIKKLKKAGVVTLTELAQCNKISIPGIGTETFQSLKAQASLQLASKGKERPLYEVLTETGKQKGLCSLPPASKLDVYFDMEGYPHMEGGLEYLFGAVSQDGNEESEFRFHDWWAHDRAQEKAAFSAFLQWIYDRYCRDASMHVYHYASYEVSALRRLSTRHACYENELDELLRAEVFVDLYSIVKNGLRIGSDSYSIKKVELLYMDKRLGEVSKATDSIVYYERWLEAPDGKSRHESELLSKIRDYNRVDCESTALLCRWLRQKQQEKAITYLPVRSQSQETETRKTKSKNEELAEQILKSLDDNKDADPERRRISELLAYILGFHQRENKVGWWEYFDRFKMSEEELLEDANCIARVRRSNKPPETYKKSLSYEYLFDPQEDVKLKAGDQLAFCTKLFDFAEVISIDDEYGILKLKRPAGAEPPPEEDSLILREAAYHDPLEESIYKQVRDYLESGRLKPCLEQLLKKSYPRLKGKQPGEPLIQGESSLDSIIRAIAALDKSYLCIQGPPGTGKTYISARSIIQLVKSGKKVGISSNSHKAIENLLDEVGLAALAEKTRINAVKVKHDNSGTLPSFKNPDIRLLTNEKTILKELDEIQIVGATAWFFAKAELANEFDYLFVDEAGQVCLANLTAMAQSCNNIVLVGDQLQLEQPVKGSHPGESGLSTLDYVLGEASTVSPERGIFLERSRRMHPNLCELVSSAVYDARLHADPITLERKLIVPDLSKLISKDSGILYIPVEHEGNSQQSSEECDAIERLIEELRACKLQHEDERRELKLDDILIVAPYNRQVRLIKERMPGAQTGSVDKFQGREKAVVIVSMCASEIESSPRGIEFLLSKKRLNVAISRAQLLAIVVGSPSLARFECSTVEQANLLNFYCRIMQEGSSKKSQDCLRV